MPGAAPGWLLLGVILHLLNQVARGVGWSAVVRASGRGAVVRRRDVIAAWVAGAGAGGIVSARGGDAVRVLLLARRAPGAGGARLTGTLAAEAAGDALLGVALVACALALGVGPALGVPLWAIGAAALAVLLAAGMVRLRRAVPTRSGSGRLRRGVPTRAGSGRLRRGVPTRAGSGRLRRIARSVAGGCAILRTPRAYALRVLPWQALSRACRLGALACFLLAFGLPATPAAVLLVTFAQSGARVLPFAPAAVGAGAALVAAGLGPVTGAPVATGDVVAFYVGTGTVLTAIGTVLALAICLRTVRWRELAAPRRDAECRLIRARHG